MPSVTPSAADSATATNEIDHRHAGGVQHAAEDVATQLVGAEPVIGRAGPAAPGAFSLARKSTSVGPHGAMRGPKTATRISIAR